MVFLAALIMIGLYLLPVFIGFLPEPLRNALESIAGSIKTQVYAPDVKGVFEMRAKASGYSLCGEYTLKPGLNHVEIYGVTDKPLQCYYVFKLPEPRDSYVLYLPWAEFHARYLRDGDVGKMMYYSLEAYGSRQAPDVLRSPTFAPFSNKCNDTICSTQRYHSLFFGVTKTVRTPDNWYFSGAYEFVTQDGLMAFSVKPVEDGLPIRYYAVFHGIVYMKGEERGVLPPPEGYTGEGLFHIFEERVLYPQGLDGPSGDLFEYVYKHVVEHLEGLGYRYCGTYKITSGMKELDVKHIVEDLRRGEACYFIIESEEPFKWQVRPYEIYPVWSENLTRTSIRTPTTICESLGIEITPFRHYFIDAVLQSKPVEKPYSECWLAHEGNEWRGDRDEWPETEWSFVPSRRAVAIFYVRTEGEGVEHLKAIVELHLNIRAWGGEKP
jgi:hypothetical protein